MSEGTTFVSEITIFYNIRSFLIKEIHFRSRRFHIEYLFFNMYFIE